MSHSYRELLSLSDDQLITAHDQRAKNTATGVSYYLDELRRREQDRTNRIMVRLTFANAALAALAVAISVAALLVSI